jgi:hypothetical protein
VRFGLSLVLSLTIASFFDLKVFQNDILAEVRRVNAKENEEVFKRARAIAESEVAQLDRQIESVKSVLDAEVSDLTSKSRARQQTYDVASANLRSEIDMLSAEKRSLESAISQNMLDLDAEELGDKRDARHSGKRGKGTLYQMALRKNARDTKRLEQVIQELNEKQAALNEIEPPVSDLLPESIAEGQKKLEDMSKQKLDMLGVIDARVERLAKADPTYQPLADGLLIRMKALESILQNHLALLQALGIGVAVMCMEMGGLLAKLFLSSPGNYAVRLAAHLRTTSCEILKDALQRELEASESLARYRESKGRAADLARRTERNARSSAVAADVFEEMLRKSAAS